MLEKESKKGRIIWGKVKHVISLQFNTFMSLYIFTFIDKYMIVMVFRVKIFIIMH